MNRTITLLSAVLIMASAVAVDARLKLARLEAQPRSKPPAAAGKIVVPVAAPATATAVVETNSLLVAALRQQVAALGAERDRLLSDLAAARLNAADAAARSSRTEGPRGGATNDVRRAAFEERMAQLQRDDPARYEEMKKRREAFRERVQQQADERTEFLQKINTTGMTDEQRANHEKLIATAEQVRVLMAQMASLPPDQAGTVRQQLGELYGSIPELYEQERRYLLEQTGRAMGYADGETGQFADYIQQIVDQTSIPRGFGRGGRGPGGNRAGAAAAAGGATAASAAGTAATATK